MTIRSIRPRAILFDLDGVLLDTSAVVAASWRQFAQEHDRPFDDDLLRRVQGRRTVDSLVAEFGLEPAEAASLADRWTEARHLTADERATIVPIPGTADFVRACGGVGLRTALVSSASDANVRFALELTGLEGRFDIVVAARDVARGKPYPDPYLLAAERLGVPPVEAVVIEDSPSGIAAGRAAGAFVVALATTFAGAPELLAGADLVIDDLLGMGPTDLLDRVFGSAAL